MNPNRDRAVDVRRRALADQIDGLERLIAAGLDEAHVVERLGHTRIELAELGATPTLQGSH
jgi:aryl carrier-like protein